MYSVAGDTGVRFGYDHYMNFFPASLWGAITKIFAARLDMD
jgi:hypothetical protein